MSEEQKKLKASERLSLLEESTIGVITNTNATSKRVGELELVIYNLSRESEILREALQLVHEKLGAVIDLSGNEDYSDENISQSMLDAKVATMVAKVKSELDLGNLELIEEIDENSFVVTRELNKDGSVENPRLQFLMSKLVPELQAKFVGVKVGGLVSGENGKLDIEIAEIYKLVEKEQEVIETSTTEAVEISEEEGLKLVNEEPKEITKDK